jgi:hypothetical protein
LVGLALLLGNLWPSLHSEVLSRGPLGERQWQLGHMRLRELSAALAADLAAGFGGWVTEWPSQREVPQALVPFLT